MSLSLVISKSVAITHKGSSSDLRGDKVTERNKKECMNFWKKKNLGTTSVSYSSFFKGFHDYFIPTDDSSCYPAMKLNLIDHDDFHLKRFVPTESSRCFGLFISEVVVAHCTLKMYLNWL